MTRLFACIALVSFALTLAASAQPVPSPVQPAPVKRTVLGKVEVPGANYDVITAMVEIAPGFKAGRHSHPGTVQRADIEQAHIFTVEQPLPFLRRQEAGAPRSPLTIRFEYQIGVTTTHLQS